MFAEPCYTQLRKTKPYYNGEWLCVTEGDILNRGMIWNILIGSSKIIQLLEAKR